MRRLMLPEFFVAEKSSLAELAAEDLLNGDADAVLLISLDDWEEAGGLVVERIVAHSLRWRRGRPHLTLCH